MLAIICKNSVSFDLPDDPQGKVTLKNWLSGVNTRAERIIIAFQDNGETVVRLKARWNGKQWQAAPIRFQHGDDVFTAWGNIQPDKYGRKDRVGYTVCVKYLYRRDTVRVENPIHGPELVAEMETV